MRAGRPRAVPLVQMDQYIEYRRSDLAEDLRPGKTLGTERYEKDGVSVLRMKVGAHEARTVGRAPGHYVTVSFMPPWLMGEEEKTSCARVIARELKYLIAQSVDLSPQKSVLAVGLGNRRLTSDAIGPAVVSKITVTGHIDPSDPLFEALGARKIFAFTPGVRGDTGMESAEETRGVCACCRPDLLLVVDALAAGHADRLCTTVQLCDTGIAPGSGVGNDRPAFDRAFFGVPVFALGVPTVMDSSSLVSSFFERAKIDPRSLPPQILSALRNGKSFFVSPKEIDAAVEVISDVVAEAIDGALDPRSFP